MARYAIAESDLPDLLASLPGWEIKAGKLHKEYKFGSFAQAMGWMVATAIYADKLDHHPEWHNVYNRVRVDLVTHDLGDAISNWDVDLAKKMDELASGQ
jgi:4a-hydroxytetrahydrobiopterin dehydratase